MSEDHSGLGIKNGWGGAGVTTVDQLEGSCGNLGKRASRPEPRHCIENGDKARAPRTISRNRIRKVGKGDSGWAPRGLL